MLSPWNRRSSADRFHRALTRTSVKTLVPFRAKRRHCGTVLKGITRVPHFPRQRRGSLGPTRVEGFFRQEGTTGRSGEWNCAVALRASEPTRFDLHPSVLATRRPSLPLQISFKTSYQSSLDYLVAKSLGGPR
jgi:hypothetical protein